MTKRKVNVSFRNVKQGDLSPLASYIVDTDGQECGCISRVCTEFGGDVQVCGCVSAENREVALICYFFSVCGWFAMSF